MRGVRGFARASRAMRERSGCRYTPPSPERGTSVCAPRDRQESKAWMQACGSRKTRAGVRLIRAIIARAPIISGLFCAARVRCDIRRSESQRTRR